MKQTILLLGGFGFLGTNLIKWIDAHAADRYDIIVFDRFPAHLGGVQFQSVSKVYSGDFSDRHLVESVFAENRIDLVVHSLSVSIPSSSVDNEFDLKFNVLPTIGLLDTMKRAGIRDIVFISSGGAVYGDEYVHPEGHAEDDVLYPRSAYGISKMTIEKYLHLYNLLYGFNPLIIRLSNPYGPYHYSRKQGIVNIALEKALAGEVFDVWGSGEGCKDYIYVEDFCRVLMTLVGKGLDGHRVVNVGSGELLSVNRILETVRDTVAADFSWTHHASNALDVQSFRLNLAQLYGLVPDFTPTPFSVGLQKTLDWYREKP